MPTPFARNPQREALLARIDSDPHGAVGYLVHALAQADAERDKLREALADLVGDVGTGFCSIPGCSGDDDPAALRLHKCSLPAARALLAQMTT